MIPGLKLMAVLAHPDDESLGVGGALAKYAAEGIETSLVTATRGDAGRFHALREGAEHPGREGLGRIREGELRAAANVLGVRDLSVLDYKDGQLDQVDPRPAISAIAEHIRRVRPHVVVTFPPDGAYGHPDHIAICQFTTAAIVAAADPAHDGGHGSPHAVAKLYYMVASESLASAYQAAFKKLISKVDGIEREGVAWPEWEITTWVDARSHWETVWRAVLCHESQVSVFENLKKLTPEQHQALWGTQQFYRVLSTVNGGRRREDDLFEGLRG
ncbi:MAG TPA: PIG-L family deacetylase [Candidatus Limnocylindria bacterium]|nr:PIG-L family deacetylase [Candidatus Limnocylindria bacterium]